MNFLTELLEVRNAAQSRLDELNDEMTNLIDEQLKISELLTELLTEIEEG